MDIHAFVQCVSVLVLTSAITTGVGVFLYQLFKNGFFDGTCCCSRRRNRGGTSVGNAAVCPEYFRPQNAVFGDGSNCATGVLMVLIDRNDYQQLYLNNARRQQRGDPPSAPPPSYEQVTSL